MLRNFLKIAVRNLSKRKTHTLINIFGLAAGMAVCLLIVLFIQDESRFLKLVLLAAAVAWPLSWLAMRQWLQEFPYRTALSGWVFIAAGAAVLLITLLTISAQAIKAALAHPARSLRTE